MIKAKEVITAIQSAAGNDKIKMGLEFAGEYGKNKILDSVDGSKTTISRWFRTRDDDWDFEDDAIDNEKISNLLELDERKVVTHLFNKN